MNLEMSPQADPLDGLAPEGGPQARSLATRWFAIPAIAVLVVVLALVFIRTGVQQLPAALVAYLNCVICFAVIRRFLQPGWSRAYRSPRCTSPSSRPISSSPPCPARAGT